MNDHAKVDQGEVWKGLPEVIGPLNPPHNVCFLSDTAENQCLSLPLLPGCPPSCFFLCYHCITLPYAISPPSALALFLSCSLYPMWKTYKELEVHSLIFPFGLSQCSGWQHRCWSQCLRSNLIPTAVWFGAGHAIFLGFHFLIWKVGIITVSTSLGCLWD